MPRIRWSGPTDDPAALFGWQLPSLVLATLFLNFFFWFAPADHFWFSGSPTVFVASLGTLTALVLVLFFLGPAFAAHETRRSLFQLAEASFGVVPALGFRICCAVLCVLWIAGVSGTLTFKILGFLLQRSFSVVESGLVAGGLMLFLFATGLQDMRTSAKLAFFTNKLGIALLIAAALRVRSYLPGVWNHLGAMETAAGSTWPPIAQPLMIIGPMALFAADFGCYSRTRRNVALIGVFGLAVPMTVALFAVSLIQRAAYRWRSDLGGLASIMVALWGGDSRWYQPQWICLALITVFGSARFGVRMWRAALAPVADNKRLRWAVFASTLLVGAVVSASQSPVFFGRSELAARFAICAAAVLSADYVARRWRAQQIRTVDWVSLVSFLTGWAAGYFLTFRPGASILIPYAASFVLCLIGRTVQRGMESG